MSDLVETKKKRKIMLVIEDADNDRFTLTMQGDCERIGVQKVGLVPTAAEHWAMEFFKICQERLDQAQDARKLNRQERRKG